MDSADPAELADIDPVDRLVDISGEAGARPADGGPVGADPGDGAGAATRGDEAAAEADAAPAPLRTVGPLDEMTVRPLRSLITAKFVAMAVLALAAIGAALLLAPQVGAGLGLAPHVAATVTSIDPLPADETASGAKCVRETVHVRWGSGHEGSFVTCGADPASGQQDGVATSGADMRVAVGDVIQVHAVAGWQSVVVGPRTPNLIVVVVLAAVLVLAGIGLVRYSRERRLIVGLMSDAITADPLPAKRIAFALAFEALSMGKGKRAMLKMRFEDESLRPLRLQIPGVATEAMQWRAATIYPVGRVRRGAPAGPYLLQTSTGGMLLAAGRRIRRRTETGAS